MRKDAAQGRDPRGAERDLRRSGGFHPQAEAPGEVVDEDVQLMLAFREGDAGAFDALFRRWSGRLLRHLDRMLGDPASAEELVQETFLRVHRARERYTPDARFSTWLYRIGTNLALNELRRPHRRAHHRSANDDDAPVLPDPAPGADAVMEARVLGRAAVRELGELPEKQRAALCLTAVEGLSYAEAAEALEVTEKGLKSLVHRARSRLATRLAELRGEGKEGLET